ncbi:hypothetical protein NDU88_002646 [Pleurodeles waltl]|uniref:Uncharacterized protein n=1 Tax=Pleurodeles waltl TaxID=8319 RepID=A0AAV7LPU7_PLEWA|nr:hypothetical protein NDU88_002646 [Pleurodeles waltl]
MGCGDDMRHTTTMLASVPSSSMTADLPVPCLTPGKQELLEVGVTCDELCMAQTQLQAGKVPGPSGFPADFWHLVWPQTCPLQLKTFKEAVDRCELPQSVDGRDCGDPKARYALRGLPTNLASEFRSKDVG